jgi:hypothetical protein
MSRLPAIMSDGWSSFLPFSDFLEAMCRKIDKYHNILLRQWRMPNPMTLRNRDTTETTNDDPVSSPV